VGRSAHDLMISSFVCGMPILDSNVEFGRERARSIAHRVRDIELPPGFRWAEDITISCAAEFA